MEESIKKIIKSILILIIIFAISIIYIKQTINFTKDKNSKGIGISSRTVDVTIADDKILCKDILVFDMITNKDINYKFVQAKEELSNVKIYINNNNDFYSTTLNMGLWNGNLNIDERLLSALKIIGNKITIKLTYELDKDYIKRYTNTDVLPYYIDLCLAYNYLHHST